MRDDRRAAAEHGGASEHGRRPVPLDQKRQRVGGVTRRREHSDLDARRGHHVALGEALGSQTVGRVECGHRRSHQLRDPWSE